MLRPVALLINLLFVDFWVVLKFEMISCCHHVLGVFKYSPKCFVVRSALRCFRELPSSLLKF